MELAAIFAAHWGRFAATHRHLLAGAHYRAAEAVLACRTAALGGQVHACGDCRRQTHVYHSCNHRACPKCGGRGQKEWAAAQEAKLPFGKLRALSGVETVARRLLHGHLHPPRRVAHFRLSRAAVVL